MTTQRSLAQKKPKDSPAMDAHGNPPYNTDEETLEHDTNPDLLATPSDLLDKEDNISINATKTDFHSPRYIYESPTSKLFSDDPRFDRRIINGILHDREAFLKEMSNQGFAAEIILKRAAELGLSEALIRQVTGVAADLAGERPGKRAAPASLGARTCLSCDRVFLSSGPGNRLCMRCRGGDAGLAQL